MNILGDFQFVGDFGNCQVHCCCYQVSSDMSQRLPHAKCQVQWCHVPSAKCQVPSKCRVSIAKYPGGECFAPPLPPQERVPQVCQPGLFKPNAWGGAQSRFRQHLEILMNIVTSDIKCFDVPWSCISSEMAPDASTSLQNMSWFIFTHIVFFVYDF